MSDAKNSEVTVIGPGTTIKGELTFTQSAQILGRIEGKVVAEKDLVVGQAGVCNAEVVAGTALVDGTISGNMTVTDRIQLNRSARVQGDLVAKTLMVAEGASYTGHCRVGGDVDLSDSIAELKQKGDVAVDGDGDLIAERASANGAAA